MPTPLTIADAQREQVYAAESFVWWGQRFRDLDEVQAYVDEVLQSRLWRRRKPAVTKVLVGSPLFLGSTAQVRGQVYCENGIVSMSLPRHARTQRYVLHELAHVLSYKRGEPYHGPRFARIYLLLVGALMGLEHARTLRTCYYGHGVEF